MPKFTPPPPQPNDPPAACEHKFVFSHNDNYWAKYSRYQLIFVDINYYYCEHCLEERMKKKEEIVNDSDTWELPDWAKAITKKGMDREY